MFKGENNCPPKETIHFTISGTLSDQQKIRVLPRPGFLSSTVFPSILAILQDRLLDEPVNNRSFPWVGSEKTP